jgi:hypothetical protein
MQTKLRFLVIIILLFCFLVTGYTQKIKIESGTAQIKVEKNITEEEATKKAEELAKINAIENAFGTFVEQESNITVNSGKSDFRIIGSTKVKGEWIETLEKKISKDFQEEKGLYGPEQTAWITCTIKGKIKRATPKANIDFSSLSCPDLNCRSTTFKSDESLYLYFKSPLNGYLSVYLEVEDTVNRLLPYSSSQNSSSVNVKADKEYFFFVANQSVSEFGKPDEVKLYTTRKQEINTLYIIFSEEDFFKPILNPGKDMKDGYFLPKSLSKSKFEEWLSQNRAILDDFLDKTISIEITSAN